jgi:hypothetical protein
MKVIYLSQADFSDLIVNTVQAKTQNKYGDMHNFKDKVELVTSEQIGDYHQFTSPENKDKVYLCVKSPQLNSALQVIMDKLSGDYGHVFKPLKDMCYIKMNKDTIIPINQLINISVSVYGVFYQASTKMSFLQMELTGFKNYPLCHFD